MRMVELGDKPTRACGCKDGGACQGHELGTARDRPVVHEGILRGNRIVRGPQWTHFGGDSDPQYEASSSEDVDNLVSLGLGRFSQCAKSMRAIEAAQEALVGYEEQIEIFCGEEGAEDLCARARFNLIQARLQLNAAHDTLVRACSRKI